MPEKIIWKGNPSQWTNFGTFLLSGLLCWLIIPLFAAIWDYLKVKFTEYELTTERIIIRRGIFKKTTDYIEYYRVKDVRVEEPFVFRFLGLSNIILITSDKISTTIKISGIPEGSRIREDLRNSIENIRAIKNVGVRDY